jgi:outer membrane lipoprotein carrier protein
MFKQMPNPGFRGESPVIRSILATFLIAAVAMNTSAGGLNALEEFLNFTRSGRADFSQVVTSPPKTGGSEKASAKIKNSSGVFEFVRPNRFRFLYKKPFEQTIVADGATLWLYDADLNQVTARKQAQALGSTPAALIATASNLKALEAEFSLQDSPEVNGLQWVVATPKAKDGQLQSIRVGFKTAADKHVVLAAMEILDSFGQRSLITFSKVELNPAFGAETFNFKPPMGADVIRQ